MISCSGSQIYTGIQHTNIVYHTNIKTRTFSQTITQSQLYQKKKQFYSKNTTKHTNWSNHVPQKQSNMPPQVGDKLGKLFLRSYKKCKTGRADYDQKNEMENNFQTILFSIQNIPLSSILFTRWTAYVLHAKLRKCGLSSSNTASLSVWEQYLTQVWFKRNRVNDDQRKNT